MHAKSVETIFRTLILQHHEDDESQMKISSVLFRYITYITINYIQTERTNTLIIIHFRNDFTPTISI